MSSESSELYRMPDAHSLLTLPNPSKVIEPYKLLIALTDREDSLKD